VGQDSNPIAERIAQLRDQWLAFANRASTRPRPDTLVFQVSCAPAAEP
jgi:hypothetical protein